MKTTKLILKNEMDFKEYLFDLIDTIFYFQNNNILINNKEYQLKLI